MPTKTAKKLIKHGTPTAKTFLEALQFLSSKSEIPNIERFFYDLKNSNTKTIGVKWGNVFKLAKESSTMDLKEISKLLDSPYYEARMGAVSIMDFQARTKSTSTESKKQLFDLYIKRHDRINNWDLVDRSAPYVVGGWLTDKPRKILDKLARSKDPWERRTAIVSTYYFIRQKDISDTFRIAEILVKDQHELVQKAVGSWIREAGKQDETQLLKFLDKHYRQMPPTMLRYAMEKLDKSTKLRYTKK